MKSKVEEKALKLIKKYSHLIEFFPTLTTNDIDEAIIESSYERMERKVKKLKLKIKHSKKVDKYVGELILARQGISKENEENKVKQEEEKSKGRKIIYSQDFSIFLEKEANSFLFHPINTPDEVVSRTKGIYLKEPLEKGEYKEVELNHLSTIQREEFVQGAKVIQEILDKKREEINSCLKQKKFINKYPEQTPDAFQTLGQVIEGREKEKRVI